MFSCRHRKNREYNPGKFESDERPCEQNRDEPGGALELSLDDVHPTTLMCMSQCNHALINEILLCVH